MPRTANPAATETTYVQRNLTHVSCALCLNRVKETRTNEHNSKPVFSFLLLVLVNIWVCLKIGYIPNEKAIFHRDNDQQNHWV